MSSWWFLPGLDDCFTQHPGRPTAGGCVRLPTLVRRGPGLPHDVLPSPDRVSVGPRFDPLPLPSPGSRTFQGRWAAVNCYDLQLPAIRAALSSAALARHVHLGLSSADSAVALLEWRLLLIDVACVALPTFYDFRFHGAADGTRHLRDPASVVTFERLFRALERDSAIPFLDAGLDARTIVGRVASLVPFDMTQHLIRSSFPTWFGDEPLPPLPRLVFSATGASLSYRAWLAGGKHAVRNT